jgi:hypothetical protein
MLDIWTTRWFWTNRRPTGNEMDVRLTRGGEGGVPALVDVVCSVGGCGIGATVEGIGAVGGGGAKSTREAEAKNGMALGVNLHRTKGSMNKRATCRFTRETCVYADVLKGFAE